MGQTSVTNRALTFRVSQEMFRLYISEIKLTVDLEFLASPVAMHGTGTVVEL